MATENPEQDLIKPAEEGTRAVMKACKQAGSVKRVVVTSSTAAVGMTRKMGEGYVFTSKDWSDPVAQVCIRARVLTDASLATKCAGQDGDRFL